MTLLQRFWILLKKVLTISPLISLFTIVFLFILFPFQDLGIFIQNTNGLRFDNLNISLFPNPGVKLNQFQVELGNSQNLVIQELRMSPSFSYFLYQKPYGSIGAQGLLKGDLDFTFSHGSKTDGNPPIDHEKLELNLQKIDLHELFQALNFNLPAQIKGQMQLHSSGTVNLTWKEQPDIDFDISTGQLDATQVRVMFPNFTDPLSLPDLILGQVTLKGRLAGGNITLEKGTFGKDNDPIQGSIKGSLGLSLNDAKIPAANQAVRLPEWVSIPITQFGSYSFDLELKIKNSFPDKTVLAIIDGVLTNYKTPIPDGNLYKFKVSGSNFFQANLGAIR